MTSGLIWTSTNGDAAGPEMLSVALWRSRKNKGAPDFQSPFVDRDIPNPLSGKAGPEV